MTGTGEMIERVARKLFDERNRIWLGAGGNPDHYVSWEAENDDFREQLRQEARTVIEAMREPTEAMALAGIEADMESGFGATMAWQAMVNKALE